MALGKRRKHARQSTMWVATTDLPRSAGHLFYERLNRVLANAGFDAFMPLIDSGIAAYVWSGPTFLSVVIYSCAPFDEPAAVAHTREFFNIPGDIVEHQF